MDHDGHVPSEAKSGSLARQDRQKQGKKRQGTAFSALAMAMAKRLCEPATVQSTIYFLLQAPHNSRWRPLLRMIPGENAGTANGGSDKAARLSLQEHPVSLLLATMARAAQYHHHHQHHHRRRRKNTLLYGAWGPRTSVPCLKP